ncbi:MAG: FecR domain-containing protein [Deltaproteobacteria bacterium]|nr:FecR domain-containing protein [Deltaproteobacteria bacterium]
MSLEQFGKKISELQDDALEKRDAFVDDFEIVRSRLFDEIEQESSSRQNYKRPILIAAALLSLLFIGVIVMLPFDNGGSFVAFKSENGVATPRSGEWITAHNGKSGIISFEDGSTVTLNDGATARVLNQSHHIAHFLLESGSAKVSVVHHKDTKWLIDAGPYKVNVIGTVFDISWNPDSGDFNINMIRGRVYVTGPMVRDGRNVTASESLSANVMAGRLEILSPEDSDAEQVEVSRINSIIKDSIGDKNSAENKSIRRVKKSEKSDDMLLDTSSWVELSNKGQFLQIINEAENMGFNSVYKMRGQDDLMALGDAARLTGNWQRAFDTYSAIRTRFKSSSAASTSAYLMGKIAFDNKKDFLNASKWLKIYLLESKGNSTLKREALGRLLESELRSNQKDSAIDTATKYIALYPDGPQAKLAAQTVSNQ